MDAIGGVGTQLKNNIMGTPDQNRIAQARMDMIARKKAQQAAMLQGQSPVSALQQGAVAGATPAPAPTSAPGLAPAPAPALPAQKKGGKVKKDKC